MLAGAPALMELPTDHPRPALRDYRGAALSVVIDEELASDLKKFSYRHGVTIFMTLLAAWAVLLSRLSGQKEVVIGIPVANRGHAELEADRFLRLYAAVGLGSGWL